MYNVFYQIPPHHGIKSCGARIEKSFLKIKKSEHTEREEHIFVEVDALTTEFGCLPTPIPICIQVVASDTRTLSKYRL